jgi:hypothetical protein
MKKLFALLLLGLISLNSQAQSGYEIKIDLKHCKDTITYLTFYQFDKTLIKDTCRNIKNGKIIFKGKEKLDKGIYSLVSQQKSIYFDFIIDESTQKIELKSDATENYLKDLNVTNPKGKNDFCNYLKFVNKQGSLLDSVYKKSKNLSKKDSIALITAKQKIFYDDVIAFEEQLYQTNKGNYIGDLLNLKIEKTLKNVPKASNGRPDSLMAYNYYKKHYWDGVNFKDDAICRTPVFANKLKRYFDLVILKHPDSTAVEIDRILDQTLQGSLLNKLLIAHFTYQYETSKVMGFDQVFVHLVDRYFKTGKADGIYENSDVVKNVIDRANKISPLLIGKTAPDLAMINIIDRPKIAQMGFETVKNSTEATNLFHAHFQEIEKTFTKLHAVKADYTLLVFWDVDCGHCQKEIPKILEEYHALQKENIDLQVFAVYTEKEYDKYIKYLDEKKLDWTNVYDGTYFNNINAKYDIVSTPVVYLLDKNKTIKAKHFSAGNLKDIIYALEKEAAK